MKPMNDIIREIRYLITGTHITPVSVVWRMQRQHDMDTQAALSNPPFEEQADGKSGKNTEHTHF